MVRNFSIILGSLLLLACVPKADSNKVASKNSSALKGTFTVEPNAQSLMATVIDVRDGEVEISTVVPAKAGQSEIRYTSVYRATNSERAVYLEKLVKKSNCQMSPQQDFTDTVVQFKALSDGAVLIAFSTSSEMLVARGLRQEIAILNEYRKVQECGADPL